MDGVSLAFPTLTGAASPPTTAAMQRRSQPRMPSTSTIELLVGDVLAARGSLRNVSQRGLGVAHLEPVGVSDGEPRTFAKGEQVVVRFELPTGPVVTEARIQWINGGQRELGLKMSPDTVSAENVSRFLASAPSSPN